MRRPLTAVLVLSLLPLASLAAPIVAAQEASPMIVAAQEGMAAAEEVLQDARRANADEAMVQRASDHLRTAEVHLEHSRPDRALDQAALGLPWAMLALWQAEGRGAQDADADFVNRAETEYQLRADEVEAVQDELNELSGEALGIDGVDGALAAADLLMQADFLLAQWPNMRNLWERGQQTEEIRRGLTSFASGSRVFIAAARSLIADAATATQEPIVLPPAWRAAADLNAHWSNQSGSVPDILLGPILGEARAEGNHPYFIGAMGMWLGHVATFRAGQAYERTPNQSFNETRDEVDDLIDGFASSRDISVRGHALRALEEIRTAENRTGEAQKQHMLTAADNAVKAATFHRTLEFMRTGEDLGTPTDPPTSAGNGSPTDGTDGSGAGSTYALVAVLVLAVIAVWMLARYRRGM